MAMIFSGEGYKLATIASPALLRRGTCAGSEQQNVEAALALGVEAERQLHEIEHFEEVRPEAR
jgi:hypothetical protein